MRYQLQNASVTFTNRANPKRAGTIWEWLFDDGSGGGFSSAGSDANSVVIAFPNVPGRLCKVRLVATGVWGSHIVHEEEFTTVDPEEMIVSMTVNGISQPTPTIPIEGSVSSSGGKGALTWEIAGPNHGLTIAPNTGRISGLFCGGVASATYLPLTIKATDCLGRVATVNQGVFNPAADYLCGVFDFGDASSYTKDGFNKVSEVRTQFKASDIYSDLKYTQATAANRPVFVEDDGEGFSCLEFNENTHSMVLSGNPGYGTTLIAVVSLLSNNISGTDRDLFGEDGIAVRQGDSCLKPGSITHAMAFPRGKFIYLQAYHDDEATYYNGVNFPGYPGAIRAKTIGSVAMSSARMRLYELIHVPIAFIGESMANKYNKHLSEKYGIPVRYY